MTDPATALAARVRVSAVYARLYAAITVWCLALPFFPLFEDVHYHEATLQYGTLFDMAGRAAGNPAMIAIVLDAALVVALLIGTIGTPAPSVPAVITALGFVLALLLIFRPGTANPTPALAPAGAAGLAITVLLVLVAAAHAVHLRSIPIYRRAAE